MLLTKVILLLSIISNIILALLLFRQRKNLHKGDSNEILKEIIDKASKNDFNFVDSSARYISEVLKRYYTIDYCTIFIRNDHKLLNIVTSNIEPFYEENIKIYCESLLEKIKSKAIISVSSDGYLKYSSAQQRLIKYSYFINLGDIGAIFIENREVYKGNRFEVDFFNLIIKNIGIVLQNCVYQDNISKLAMKDNLTEMYNRNYMHGHIERLLKQNDRLIIAIMDIDHFKRINDTYGHDIGDEVLVGLSRFVKSRIADQDEIYRWGGEEFILSFSNQDIRDVESKLNVIREEIRKLRIHDIDITVSFGVAKYDIKNDMSYTLKAADNALYYSKDNGRNKVTVYKELA